MHDDGLSRITIRRRLLRLATERKLNLVDCALFGVIYGLVSTTGNGWFLLGLVPAAAISSFLEGLADAR